jgi:glycosyltransferase involved in cell wall biosynthesis
MRILYLTFYFEPDLCAGSFRNTPLAKQLAYQAKEEDIEIHVLTTQPNRYASYEKKGKVKEIQDNLTIYRIDIPKHKSKFIDQMNSFYSYYKGVMRETRGITYDLVFASSSRLFTAYLGYKISKKEGIPLYLDVRDIFTDTMKDVLKVPIVRKLLIGILKHIEDRVFRHALHINIISGGFDSYFKQFNIKNISNFTHGIDNEFLNLVADNNNKTNSLVITYAGNIGEGQGLHKIIPLAAESLGKDFLFRIIGDGGKMFKLKNEIQKLQLTNVSIEKPLGREALKKVYSRSDFLLIHLNNYEAFKKVLPSKVFEMGAYDKPIIAGVSGYAREFITEHIENVILFEPGNANELVTKLKNYKYQKVKRDKFINKFQRESINKDMAKSILSYLKIN